MPCTGSPATPTRSSTTWPPPWTGPARPPPSGPGGERFLADLQGAPIQDPVLPAVLHTVRAFDLDVGDFERFLDSMAMDLTVDGYATYHDLCGYMEGQRR